MTADAPADRRILAYARLIDPEVWPEGGIPPATSATASRIRRSLEAACRIAVHEDVVSDPAAALASLRRETGLEDEGPGPELPGGTDGRETSRLVAILLAGRDPADGEHPGDEVRARPEQEPPGEPDDEDDGDRDEERSDCDADCDPDHDPEGGISHVGDADEGQHQEER
jgi:hypothetical protein